MTQFDGFAEDFERHAEVSADNALYDPPAMLALLGPVEGEDVLDAGCGPGLYAEELLTRGAARVVGCDESREMVALAERRLDGRAELRGHDLQTPLGWVDDATFDAVVLALVIHHLDDRVAALRELHRVVRPGGRLVMSTNHPVGDWVRKGGSYFTTELIEETWSRGWTVRYWRRPLTETCAEIAEAGFIMFRLRKP